MIGQAKESEANECVAARREWDDGSEGGVNGTNDEVTHGGPPTLRRWGRLAAGSTGARSKWPLS